MTLIDLDRPALSSRAHRTRRAVAAAVGGAALVLLAAAEPRTHQPAVIVSTAGVGSAASAIWTASGKQVTPAWGQPTRIPGGPARVSVIGWAESADARCVIRIDGRVVAEQQAGGIGRPVSCVWPE